MMEEEAKTTQEAQPQPAQEEKKCSCDSKATVKYAIGGVLVLAGLFFFFKWWSEVFALFQGVFGPFLILAGLITLAIAKE